MTTAHKPTWHPAVGTAHQGGYRYHASRVQYSSRDMASHTKLKVRQVGQNAPEEMESRDAKAELEDRERKHQEKIKAEKRKAGLLTYAEESTENPVEAIEHISEKEKGEDESEEAPAPVDPIKAIAGVDWKKIDDGDDSDSDNDEDKSEDELNEEAELKKELAKIKKEREAEAKRKELEEKAAAEKAMEEEILRGNPLLNLTSGTDSFAIKRHWNDDVVFKNQSRDARRVKKRFINDTIRSDFHKNFLRKYIH